MKLTSTRFAIVGTAVLGVAAAAGYYGWQARNVRSTQEALTRIDSEVKRGWSDIENDVHQLANSPIVEGIRIMQNPLVTPLRDATAATPDERASALEEVAGAARDAQPGMLADLPSLVQALNIVRQLKDGNSRGVAESSLGMLLDLVAQTSSEVQAAQRSIFASATSTGGPTAGTVAVGTYTAALVSG